MWEQFVQAAHLSGVVRVPRDVDLGRADDASFMAQSMPWIDPMKEAEAWEKLVRSGFASEFEVLRKRGVNSMDLLEQIATFRQASKDRELVFSSDASNTPQTSSSGDSPQSEAQTSTLVSLAGAVAVMAAKPPVNVVVPHPKQSVQVVERDPDTMEITRSVTRYEH